MSVGTSLAIRLKEDPQTFALTDFTFWASPQMTLAAFEQSGLAITVDFSMDTDRASMAVSSTDCSAIFASTDLLQSFGTFGTVSTCYCIFLAWLCLHAIHAAHVLT
jgi:hypothetical protein